MSQPFKIAVILAFAALPLLEIGLLILEREATYRAEKPTMPMRCGSIPHSMALPRTRLRQWLLAAARCAVLSLLIAAYAGPVLEPSGGGPWPAA